MNAKRKQPHWMRTDKALLDLRFALREKKFELLIGRDGTIYGRWKRKK